MASNYGKFKGATSEDIDVIHKIILGILIVMITTLIALFAVMWGVLNDDNLEKKAIYLDLVKNVNELDRKINNQNEDLLELKNEIKTDQKVLQLLCRRFNISC